MRATEPAGARTIPRARSDDRPVCRGGRSELLARFSARPDRRLGQRFVVSNAPRQHQSRTLSACVEACATRCLSPASALPQSIVYKKLAFDPQVDLEPITLIAPRHRARRSARAAGDTLAEFIAYVKARPAAPLRLLWRRSGPHLATELFQGKTGSRMVHVPMAAAGRPGRRHDRPGAGAVPQRAAGARMIRGGEAQSHAIRADRRSELRRDVPTFLESGLDLSHGPCRVLRSPKTPPDIIATLHTRPRPSSRIAVRAKIIEQGAEVVASSPAESAPSSRTRASGWRG